MTSERSLGKLAEEDVLFVTDGYRTRRDQLVEGGAPILRVSHVQDGFISVDKTDEISREYEERFTLKSALLNDSVITTKGTVGRAARISENHVGYVYSPQVCVLRSIDHETIDPRWLYCWVRSPQMQQQLDRYSGQTDMAPYVKLKDLRSFTISVPPIEEQRAIAEVLGALDDRIEWTARSGALIHACVRTLAEAHEAAASAVPLSDLAEIRRETISTESLDGQVWAHYSIPAFDEGQEPVIELGDGIRSGKYRVPDACVLVSKLNPKWHRVWLPPSPEAHGPICSTEFMPIVPKDHDLLAPLWAALLSANFNQQMRERVTGSTGSHQRVRPDDLMACAVANVRTMDAGSRQLIAALAERLLLLRGERKRLASMRDALLPKLLSGELRIEDPARLVGAAA